MVTAWTRVRGTPDPPQQVRELRAGGLRVLLDGVDLRSMRTGDAELVRRVYVAVRDKGWNTLPGTVSQLHVEDKDDAFEVRFSSRHSGSDVDFSWEGRIIGHESGEVTYEMKGVADADCTYNRIGFCILFPGDRAAGRHYAAKSSVGSSEGELPVLIGPQRFGGHSFDPLFPAFAELRLTYTDGGVACRIDGDLLEMEDQRNWSDASFKAYCTPLALGQPKVLERGSRLAQVVKLTGLESQGAGRRRNEVLLDLAPTGGYVVPPIGLGAPSRSLQFSTPQTSLLARLRPSHLRLDLHLNAKSWPEQLSTFAHQAAGISAGLELALYLRNEDAEELKKLANRASKADVRRVLVNWEGARKGTREETTPASLVDLVRETLSLTAPIAGGTDLHFCQLNRTRPEATLLDGIFWPIAAEVHAFDDRSVLETPQTHGEQVLTARSFAAGRPLFVGPVTLRPRNDLIGHPTDPTAHDPAWLPGQADVRQPSLLAAAWLLASLKYLVEAGADSLTFFEPVGPCGVMPADAAESPAQAGLTAAVYPLFHVLADVIGYQDAVVLTCASSRPLDVVGLGITADDKTTVLIANLTPESQTVIFSRPIRGPLVRRLNQATAEQAVQAIDEFRGDVRSEVLKGDRGLELDAYETVRLDF